MPLSDSLKHTEVKSPSEIFTILNELIKTFGLHTPYYGGDLYRLHQKGEYAKCVEIIRTRLGVLPKVKVRQFEDDAFTKRHKETTLGIVIHPAEYPTFGSHAMKQMVITIEVPKSALKDYYTFVKVIAHELSHVALHSVRHYMRHSEIATELLQFVFGFGVIRTVCAERSGHTQCGYLKLSDIEITNAHLEGKYSFTQNLRVKVFTYLHSFKSLWF